MKLFLCQFGTLCLVGAAHAQTPASLSEWLSSREGVAISAPSLPLTNLPPPSAPAPAPAPAPVSQIPMVEVLAPITTVADALTAVSIAAPVSSLPPLLAPENTGRTKLEATRVQVEWVDMQRAPNLSRPFAVDPLKSSAEKEAYWASSVRLSSSTSQEEPVSRVWDIRLQDVSVRRLLQRWAQDAQYQLIWEATRDFPVQVEVRIEGDFRNAVGAVMEALSVTDYPVQALINSDLRQMRVIRYLQGQAR